MRGDDKQESVGGIFGCVGDGEAAVADTRSPLQSEEVHAASTLRVPSAKKLLEDGRSGRRATETHSQFTA